MLLEKGKTGSFPFHCEHDTLYVMSDPNKFSVDELKHLGELGFHRGDDSNFYSYRFGSA